MQWDDREDEGEVKVGGGASVTPGLGGVWDDAIGRYVCSCV